LLPSFDLRLCSDMDADLVKCAQLAAEARQLEAKAVEFDCQGSASEAAFHHKRAAAKCNDAANLCPPGHPDGPRLEEYAQELLLRVVYLESLNGAPITIQLEDHVGDLDLTLELPENPAPAQDTQEEVAALLSQMGVSGSTAPITEEGYQQVAALHKDEEMQTFILRILEADKRQLREGCEAELLALVPRCRAGGDMKGLTELRIELSRASWIDLKLDMTKDKLQIAVDIEQEARSLEAQGRKSEAAAMFDRAVTLLQYVIKNDPRCQNQKIKDMISKRLEDLQACSAALILSGS